MHRALIVITLSLSLTACGSIAWTRAATDEAQRQRDEKECDFEARKATASYVGNPFLSPKVDIEHACMRLRGYALKRAEPK